MNRKSFLQKAIGGLVLANIPFSSVQGKNTGKSAGISICDWNLGELADPSYIPLAEKLGFQGIQVSIGTGPDHLPLREQSVRNQYLELGKKHNITFNSVSCGRILNQIPLATEPQSTVYVIDSLEAAKVLGAKNILTAFFGNAHLLKRDASGEFIKKPGGDYPEYEWIDEDIERLVALLKQLVPRAEDLGVIIGLENTLSADQNLQILDEVNSPMVQVYYDTGNSWGRGYDVPGEIRKIGNDRMCEVHIKNSGSPLLYGNHGDVNMEACADALNDIGYDKWLVLETSGRNGRFEEDTKANVAFVQKTFL